MNVAIVGWGRVINISSVMAMIAHPQKTPYCATKTGLVGFTRVSMYNQF